LAISFDGGFAYILQRKRVIVVVRDNDANLSKAFLYLMRDIVLHEKEAENGMIFHASCVTIEGAGLMFVGSKGAGKTTCAMLSLLEKDASYISND